MSVSWTLPSKLPSTVSVVVPVVFVNTYEINRFVYPDVSNQPLTTGDPATVTGVMYSQTFQPGGVTGTLFHALRRGGPGRAGLRHRLRLPRIHQPEQWSAILVRLEHLQVQFHQVIGLGIRLTLDDPALRAVLPLLNQIVLRLVILHSAHGPSRVNGQPAEQGRAGRRRRRRGRRPVRRPDGDLRRVRHRVPGRPLLDGDRRPGSVLIRVADRGIPRRHDCRLSLTGAGDWHAPPGPSRSRGRAPVLCDQRPFMTRKPLATATWEPVRQNMNQPACPEGSCEPEPFTRGS